MLRSPIAWAAGVGLIYAAIYIWAMYRFGGRVDFEVAALPASAAFGSVLNLTLIAKFVRTDSSRLGAVAEDRPAIVLGLMFSLIFTFSTALRALLAALGP